MMKWRVANGKWRMAVPGIRHSPLATRHFSELCVASFVCLIMNSAEDIDRIIQMAWEDRTPFEAIRVQFGLKEDEVKALMKRELKASSYRLWRERVEACATKHAKLRSSDIGRFKSKAQRSITNNKISKR